MRDMGRKKDWVGSKLLLGENVPGKGGTNTKAERRAREAFVVIAQSLSRVWLCSPMDCSTPGFPVHHQLPELAQTHVHRVSDASQPSHPLVSPSPPALNLSQHQGFGGGGFLMSQLFASGGQSMKHSATSQRFSKTGILCKELWIARQQETEQPDKGTVARTLHATSGRSINFNLKVIGSHWMIFSKKMASVQRVLEHLLYTRHSGCLGTRQTQTSPSNQDWQRKS